MTESVKRGRLLFSVVNKWERKRERKEVIKYVIF